MKIERDKWYVMRNGERVRVVCVDAPGSFPVLGVGNDGVPMSFTDIGCYDPPAKSDFDLISEHREPARVWVNLYGDGSGYSYPDEERAKLNARNMAFCRIAVEFVEVVNGRDDG